MRTRLVGILVATVVLALPGCGVGGGSDGASVSPDPTTTTTAPPAAVLDGAAVLRRLRSSIALLDTPTASGSAVLVDGGYLVTNAHVVDPFGVADVTFEGEDTEQNIEVVGVDLDADLAVLGPIDTDHPAVTIEDPSGLDQGSALFLVGFPGDQEDPEVTISSGVLSRRRSLDDWGLEYLQSDAKIAPGQSGGAAVDAQGRVVGISGLSDEDDFALSLAGADVASAVEAIEAGDGSAYTPVPSEATDRQASFALDGPEDHRTLYLPATDQDREVTVGLAGPDPLVELDDVDFYPEALNAAAASSYGPDDQPDGGLPDPTPPDADGRWTFSIDAGYPALLTVGSASATPTPLAVTTTEPFTVVRGDPTVVDLEVGAEPVEGVLGYFDDTRVYDLTLEKGETIDISASSAVGDVAYAVVAPGSAFAAGDMVDDTGGGLFGLDAESSYTAEAAGIHQLYVSQVEGLSTGFRLTVDRG